MTTPPEIYMLWADGCLTTKEAIKMLAGIGSKGALTCLKQIERIVAEYAV